MVCCWGAAGAELETSLSGEGMAWRKGKLIFRVKTALLIQNPRIGFSGSPSGQVSDSPSKLEDSAGPFCICLLPSLGCWRAVPVVFSCSV